MYLLLVEAAKMSMTKGGFRLSYNFETDEVQVLDKRSGDLNYIINGENDPMLSSTLTYFGLHKVPIIAY